MGKIVENIIDPPVTLYSSYEDIDDWISELKAMEQTPNVKVALEQALSWLRSHPDAK